MLVAARPLFAFSLLSKNWILILAVLARLASPATADFSYLVLAGYALLGRRQVIQALLLSWLFTMINPGLAPDAAYAAIGRYLVLSSAFLSVVLRGGFSNQDRFFWFTIALGGFFILHAVVVSPMPDVSILKTMAWTITIMVLLAAWSGLNHFQRARMQQWLFGFMVLVTVMSLPFLAVSGTGYLRNGSGFQGILNHPQAFGLAMAMIGALVMGRFLTQKRPSWALLAMALGCIVLIVLSEARTAGMALILALGISIVLIRTFGGQSIRSAMPALRSKRFFVLALLFLLVLIVPGSPLPSVVNDYISKSGPADVDNLLGVYQASRAVLFEPMIANISENPILGIGFGIASDSTAMNVVRDPLFGIAISAPVEKGTLPLVILEETGVVGFILVAIWILFLLRRAAANGIASFLVVTTMLLINLGESVLFSPGGMGMLMLILLSFAVTKPKSTKFSQTNSYEVSVNA